MERHFANAQPVAEYLVGQGQVLSVNYAGLPDSRWHERATKLGGGKGYGSVLAFEIEGGLEAGKRFVEALELHSHVANIGDVRSLVIHPASTTHSQLTPEEQLASGRAPRASSASASARVDRRHPRRPRQGLRRSEGLTRRSSRAGRVAARGRGVRVRRRAGRARNSSKRSARSSAGAQRRLGAAVVLDLQHPDVGPQLLVVGDGLVVQRRPSARSSRRGRRRCGTPSTWARWPMQRGDGQRVLGVDEVVRHADAQRDRRDAGAARARRGARRRAR